MENNEKQANLASFMTAKTDNKEGGNLLTNKTQKSLDQANQKKEDEEKKELEDAKKNSNALANRYGKGDMMKMQVRNLIMMLPFIIIGIVILLLLLFKGGDFVGMLLNGFLNSATGAK